MTSTISPQILAPAGNRESFLAAIGAGADAIYVGLKEFSARKEAPNFTPGELYPLIDLAHSRNIKVYITLNTLILQSEIKKIATLFKEWLLPLGPDGIIVQDLSIIKIARDTGYRGEIHLSTLGAWHISSSFRMLKKMTVERVVLPRELTIDEIKQISKRCRGIGIGLEVFVHGALCYGISGRCYWSSMLGGKSGLRGRCVQPCRRIYRMGNIKGRFFSSRDLSVDVLTKIFLNIPNIVCWKIEGRKKGPHYVFYTTKAYKLLRDHPSDSTAKKAALEFLEMALGRAATHYNLLSHRRYCPIDEKGETASGLFIGKVGRDKGRTFIRPTRPLLPLDILRIGYQDQRGHRILKISTYVPKGKKFFLPPKIQSQPGTEAFLIDRREPELLTIIKQLQRDLLLSKANITKKSSQASYMVPKSNKRHALSSLSYLKVILSPRKSKSKKEETALWIYPDISLIDLKKSISTTQWLWMPPYVWPEEEKQIEHLISAALKMGFSKFILNSIYQLSLFPDKKGLSLWLGPFANISNTLSIYMAKEMGFCGVIISPELSKKEILGIPLQSPLPVGIVVKGVWPFCISRTKLEKVEENTLLVSPKGEGLWLKKIGQNYFLFPNWTLDISHRISTLKKAGFSFFIYLDVSIPVPHKKRRFEFNWNIPNL